MLVKWRHVCIVFGSDISDSWLYKSMLKGVSALVTYCILHKAYSIRCIKYLLLQMEMTCKCKDVCQLFVAHVVISTIILLYI